MSNSLGDAMKTSHNKSGRSNIPHAKYTVRISDFDKANTASRSFIEGRNCHNCLMRTTGQTGSTECLVEVIRNQWPEPFENQAYCLHPDIKRFVDMAGTVLSRFDERKSRRANDTLTACSA